MISSYTLPLTPLQLSQDATAVPTDGRPTGALYSHTVLTPGLTTRKTTTEDPITVLTAQLYSYIYFMRYITPYTPYTPL